MIFTENLSALVQFQEGYKKHKYIDILGNETIGIGFNLSEGFSIQECVLILNYRLNNLTASLTSQVKPFSHLSDIRQSVLISMAYNMGIGGLLAFTKMLDAINANDFELAAQEMERSDWFKQVGQRAIDLQYMMRFNDYPPSLAKELLIYEREN